MLPVPRIAVISPYRQVFRESPQAPCRTALPLLATTTISVVPLATSRTRRPQPKPLLHEGQLPRTRSWPRISAEVAFATIPRRAYAQSRRDKRGGVPLRPKPVGPTPYLRECFLHNIFCGLTVADDVLQEHHQSRRILPVKCVECLRVSPRNLLPKILVVGQSVSPSCYSGLQAKRFARQLGKYGWRELRIHGDHPKNQRRPRQNPPTGKGGRLRKTW